MCMSDAACVEGDEQWKQGLQAMCIQLHHTPHYNFNI